MQISRWLAGAGALVLAATTSTAHAASLAAPDGQRWLTVASTKNKDVGIGIAGWYASEHAKVVTSESGWYAVVLGPYSEPDVAAILKAHPEIGEVPKDALLSRGDTYLEAVWEEKPFEQNRPLANYEIEKPARFSSGDLTFEVSMSGTGDDPGPTLATGTGKSGPLFSFTTKKDYALFGSDAGLLKLDPATNVPQLVFTRFTGGAHCCTQTWIATAPEASSGWTLVDTGVLDGSGFSYEDVDGDGALELLSVDNNFLYAFDSYAGSFAPIRIKQLRGAVVRDVSNDAEFAAQLRRDLARMEFGVKLDPTLWKSNGFLAGWVAAKQRLGQGEDAWTVALENLDQNSDFGPQTCKTGKPLEDCSFDDLERVPVAKALAAFLADGDYGELPPIAQALLR